LKTIAESAFNHNGSLPYTLELAKAAKEAGADYFTVQVMDVAAFCVEDYSKYEIYENNTLSFENWRKVFSRCRELEIDVIPCVLDIPSFDFCYEEGFRFLKLHATDITNKTMLEKMATYSDVTFILETQCATNLEIKYALGIIGDQVTCLMHGFSNYPTEVEDLNLNSLDYLKQEFPQYTTGLADHSLDTTNIPLMVLAKGCEYLEKHITLTRNNRKFDYQVSLYPHEFAVMVQQLKHYSLALGEYKKHPTKTELPYRNVMYKKVLGGGDFKRADAGVDFMTHQFNSFQRADVGIALIARLKSKRLPLKVLKPFGGTSIIDFLYSRLKTAEKVKDVFLATSTLAEDTPLAEVGHQNGHKVYRGHAVSVLDRMLELSLQEQWGAVFRVTGDNPFTDPELIDEMIDLMLANDLDYVRANNVPFGVSAELFSTKYLWNLYLNMENPMHSEYLTLFILNDEKARKGCVDIVSDVEDLKYINLSVDYQQDYDRALQLSEALESSKLKECNLSDMVAVIDNFKREDKTKLIKLPEGEDIPFSEFLGRLENQTYTVRKQWHI
jgi:sialic acid synthase SpsE/spore coat polysaccharide biosynthesis protein SpsF (cytidylyltransferase family)|tara:strand:- start:174280 stop:175944 length:1665 start_codon:yes stop_codon:yes gene_type:complete